MSDQDTTVAQLRKLVEDFVAQRDWQRFHTPKNLAMSLAIEAAELMEHFQWLTAEQSQTLRDQPETLRPVAEELADVFCYGLAMANVLGLDVSSAICAKLAKNEQKYPVEEYRGRYGPQDASPPARGAV